MENSLVKQWKSTWSLKDIALCNRKCSTNTLSIMISLLKSKQKSNTRRRLRCERIAVRKLLKSSRIRSQVMLKTMVKSGRVTSKEPLTQKRRKKTKLPLHKRSPWSQLTKKRKRSQWKRRNPRRKQPNNVWTMKVNGKMKAKARQKKRLKSENPSCSVASWRKISQRNIASIESSNSLFSYSMPKRNINKYMKLLIKGLQRRLWTKEENWNSRTERLLDIVHCDTSTRNTTDPWATTHQEWDRFSENLATSKDRLCLLHRTSQS